MAQGLLLRALHGSRLNLCVTAATDAMYLHKNRKYVIDRNRKYSKCPTCSIPPDHDKDPCAHKVCNIKPKKKSFWKRLFETEPDEKPVELPPKACCRKRQQATIREDPDLSQFGGVAYRTCGPAYLIQKDTLPTEEHETTKEELILKKIEADPEFKEHVNEDPVSKFKSTEMRMLELSDKKLHPLYKKFSGVKKRYIQEQKKKMYKTVSWPIDMHEIPARLNINSDVVDKKNMEYLEFKRIEPPRQLVERIVEIERNARPTMEKGRRKAHSGEKQVEVTGDAGGSVFETLTMQRGTKY